MKGRGGSSQLTEAELLKLGMQGMAQELRDPYAAYLSPATYAALRQRMGGAAAAGLGLQIVKDHAGEPVAVLEACPGSPAQAAGLRPGDVVLSINDSATAGLAIDEARSALQGEVGSEVALMIKRRGQGLHEQVLLRRVAGDGHSVEHRLLDSPECRIGYLRILTFGSRTPQEVEQALRDLEQQGANCLLLDLRNNGGGLLAAAINVCALFVPEGAPVVTVRQRRSSVTHRAPAGPRFGLPVTVLINENSASSAEITAAALHEHGVARLVGVKSFGKGTVQRFLPLEDGGALKLTVARYLTSRGQDVQGRGLQPDVVIGAPGSGIGELRDEQLSETMRQIARTFPKEGRRTSSR